MSPDEMELHTSFPPMRCAGKLAIQGNIPDPWEIVVLGWATVHLLVFASRLRYCIREGKAEYHRVLGR